MTRFVDSALWYCGNLILCDSPNQCAWLIGMHIIMGYLVGITPKHTLCFWYAHAVSLARGCARSDMPHMPDILQVWGLQCATTVQQVSSSQ